MDIYTFNVISHILLGKFHCVVRYSLGPSLFLNFPFCPQRVSAVKSKARQGNLNLFVSSFKSYAPPYNRRKHGSAEVITVGQQR